MEENIGNLKKNRLSKPGILVAGLIVLIVIPLVVGLAAKIFPGIPTGLKDEKTDFAHTSLSFSEEPRVSSISGTYEVDLNVDTDDNNISGVSLELAYDPKSLGKVDIKPGNFLPNPAVIEKEIDTVNGRITYILGPRLGSEGVKGKGTVAVISFSKLNNSETTIDFLPQTQVSAQGFDQSVLRETVSAVIGALPSSSDVNFISPEGTQNPSQ